MATLIIRRWKRGWDIDYRNSAGGGFSNGAKTLAIALYKGLSVEELPRFVKINGQDIPVTDAWDIMSRRWTSQHRDMLPPRPAIVN